MEEGTLEFHACRQCKIKHVDTRFKYSLQVRLSPPEGTDKQAKVATQSLC